MPRFHPPAPPSPYATRIIRLIRAAFALWVAPFAASAAVAIDGRIDPEEWRDAQHITNFRQTQPLNGKPARLRTEAWVLATPDGLAVAFRNAQPAGVPRTHQRTRRDENASVDRVNVMIDFNADGRTGYDFTLTLTGGISDAVITNESSLNNDWDGIWQHAVSEDAEGWNAELLIPWHTAPMRKATAGVRVIGLYLDRVLGSTGERVAWPEASLARARFLSDFKQVELPAYRQPLLAITPHALSVYDNVIGGSELDGGVDLLWKPNGQMQLTATVNPDFGQVESDDLIVNFSSEETFFSDKRPFFTENHGIFDFDLLLRNSQLIYTRRVGALADDGSGPGAIDGALKLNGNIGSTSYGVMAAQENGDAGRQFSALRLQQDFGTQMLGVLATHVDRPWLEREASVVGVDHRWLPDDHWMVKSSIVGSQIDQHASVHHGAGATLSVQQEINDTWSQQWYAMHFDDRLDINDFGYLRRNDLDYVDWELRRRFTDPPATSAYRSTEWQLLASAMNNGRGLAVQRQLRITRKGSLRNGGNETIEVNLNHAAHDDLLTRGHGALQTATYPTVLWMRSVPRKDDWSWRALVEVVGEPLSGMARPGYRFELEPTYFFNDALSVSVELGWEAKADWLVWQCDNLLGSFRSRSAQLAAGVAWNIDDRQELRVRLQALGLDARLRQAWRVDSAQRAQPVNDPVEDFSIRNLGLQIRYRYELAPLSDFYIVYGRGGYAYDPMFAPVGRQFVDSFNLRDSEQLLLKLSYRFEL